MRILKEVKEFFKITWPIMIGMWILNIIIFKQATEINDLKKENMFYKDTLVYSVDLQTDMLEAMTMWSIKIVDEYCIETEKKTHAEAKWPFTYWCMFNSWYAYNEYKKIVDANNYITNNIQALLPQSTWTTEESLATDNVQPKVSKTEN